MLRLSKIDNVAALKDNTPLVEHYFMNSAQIDPDDMVLLNGRGALEFVASAAYGYRHRGFVSFISNFAPSLSYDVYDAVMKMNFEKAQVALEGMLPIYRALGESNSKRQDVTILPPAYRTNYMYLGVGKACLDLVGLNGGKLKLPMQDLSAEEKNILKNALEEMDLI